MEGGELRGADEGRDWQEESCHPEEPRRERSDVDNAGNEGTPQRATESRPNAEDWVNSSLGIFPTSCREVAEPANLREGMATQRVKEVRTYFRTVDNSGGPQPLVEST